MKKLILILFSLLLFSFPAEAQILKKLKNKIEKKVEDKVTDRVSDKAANETDSLMNQMLGNQMKSSGMMPMGVEQVSLEEVPAQYDFNWKYNAQVNTTQGNMEMIYRLKNKALYMGIEMHQGADVLMVMDTKNDLMAMFFDSQGKNMLMASRMKANKTSAEDDFYKDAQVKQIDGKKILGYNCEGYEVETDNHIVQFYVTNEADVSFTQMYKYEKSKLPPAIKQEWLKNGNSLMMEIQMVDKNAPANNVSMVCTGLKREDMIIKKSNYQDMYGN